MWLARTVHVSYYKARQLLQERSETRSTVAAMDAMVAAWMIAVLLLDLPSVLP